MVASVHVTLLLAGEREAGGEDGGCGGGGDMMRPEPTSGVIVPELEPD